MNKIINNIQRTENKSLKDARSKYFIRKAGYQENIISNMMTSKNLTRTQAQDYFKSLVVKGNYNKIKSFYG